MKRGRKLLLLCLALALLGACYFGVRRLTAEPDQEEGIALAGPASPARLSWTGDGGSLTLENGEEGWSWADDAGFPLDQTAPETMTAALSSLTASRQLDSPEALADYGLDEPALTITAVDQDGTEYTYAFGDANEMTGEYYLLYNGEEDTVYLVGSDLHDAFDRDLYDMVEMEALPDFGTVTALAVEQSGGSLSLFRTEDGGALCYDADRTWFLSRDGESLALDASKVSALTGAVTGLSWQSCVNYDADQEELTAFGLDEESAAAVTLTYRPDSDQEEEAAEETFTLLLGKDSDQGAYARLDGSAMVYLIDSETASSLRYASYASLRSDSVLTLDWDTADSLTLTWKGESRTISFGETEAEHEEGEPETQPLYTCGGQELDQTRTEELLDAVDSLTASGEAAGAQGGEPLLTLSIQRNTGGDFDQLTLTLSAWDTASCLASLTGEPDRLVDRSAVNTLTGLAEELFSE